MVAGRLGGIFARCRVERERGRESKRGGANSDSTLSLDAAQTRAYSCMSSIPVLSQAVKPRHVYQSDIAMMLLALCAIREPDDALTQYIEDVVRNHVQQLVLQARAQAARRNAKAVAVEDLVFLVRHDRARLNRLRTYLSWKDVRKKMRELDQVGGAVTTATTGDDDTQIDSIEEPVSDKSLKVIKTTVRLPWELNDAWADYLHTVDDDPEDDEAEAYEVNKQRLREADLLTSRMSREEYEQYSQARQASFVFRKSQLFPPPLPLGSALRDRSDAFPPSLPGGPKHADKKFRDFIALPAILDLVAPQDEVLDVLGFLAYECVRALCDAGVAHKKSVVEAKRQVAEMEKRRKIREGKKRKRDEAEEADAADVGAGSETNTDGAALKAEDPSTPASNASPGQARSPNKKDNDNRASPTRKTLKDAGPTNDKQKEASSPSSSSSSSSPSSPKRKPLEIPTSLFSAPLPDAAASVPAFGAAAAAILLGGSEANGGTAAGSAAESATAAAAAAARVLFQLEDVELGLHAVEHTYASLKTSGMRNWRGGISRIPTRLV